jgi:hypothetical protein
VAAVGVAGGGGGEQVGRPQEPGDIGGGRLLVELGRGADLLDAAAGHHGQAVRHGEGLLLVVGDVDEGDPDRLLERLELDLEGLAELGVQRPEGLVQHQHRRVEDQRPGKGDPLLLAARQLGRPAPLQALELDQSKGLGDPAAGLGLAHVLEAQPKGDVVGHVQEREQGVALEDGVDLALVRRGAGHVDPVKQNAAVGGLLEPGDQPQGGRLAAARRTEEGEELAPGHVQVDPVDRGHVLEPLDQPDQPDLASSHAATPFSHPLPGAS